MIRTWPLQLHKSGEAPAEQNVGHVGGSEPEISVGERLYPAEPAVPRERSCETVAASRENENGQPRNPNGESHAKNHSLQSKRGNSRRSTIGVSVCAGRHGAADHGATTTEALSLGEGLEKRIQHRGAAWRVGRVACDGGHNRMVKRSDVVQQR